MVLVHAHSSAVALRQSLSTWRDLVYAAPVAVGTPSQNFRLIVSDLSHGPAVAERCCVGCCHMRWYDPHKSTTFHIQPPLGGPFGCLLGEDPPGRCFEFRESLQIIGDSTLSMRYNYSRTVQEVPAEITFAKQPFDGILGLDPYDGTPSTGIINTAYALGLLKAPVYTVNFQRKCADGIAENAGVITYGEADTINCDTNINYVNTYGVDAKFTELRLGSLKLTPRNSAKYWSSVSSSYTEPNILVATEDVDPFDANPKPQPLDQILAELNAVKEDATGLYTVDCSSVPTFTDLTLVINGVTYCQIVDYTRKHDIGWSRNLHTSPPMCTYSTNDAEARSGSVCESPKDPVKCTDMNTKPAPAPNEGTIPPKDTTETSKSTTDASTTKALDATDPQTVAGSETATPHKNPAGAPKTPTDSSSGNSGGCLLLPAEALLYLLPLLVLAL